MSITFFMTPFDPKAWADPEDTSSKPTSDLEIDPYVYRGKLKERWPEISLQNLDETFSLQWELPSKVIGYGGLQGRLQLFAGQPVVTFGTGPNKKSFTEFILWYRAFVPEIYSLYLSNSSAWTDSLVLTQKTTEQDIVDFTGIVD